MQTATRDQLQTRTVLFHGDDREAPVVLVALSQNHAQRLVSILDCAKLSYDAMSSRSSIETINFIASLQARLTVS